MPFAIEMLRFIVTIFGKISIDGRTSYVSSSPIANNKWWNEKRKKKRISNLPNAIAGRWRWSIVGCVGGSGDGGGGRRRRCRRYDWHAWLQWRWCNCIGRWFIDHHVNCQRCIVRTLAHRLPLITSTIRRLVFPIQNDFVRCDGWLHRLLMCHLEIVRFRHAATRSHAIRMWFGRGHFDGFAWQYWWCHVVKWIGFDEWFAGRRTGKAVATIGRREFGIGFGQLTHVSHHFDRWRWQWFITIECVHIDFGWMQWRWWWWQIGTRYSELWIFWRSFGHPIV